MTDPSVSITDLRKTYNATVAVDNLSLQVFPGQVLGLLGPNGSGKTTTLKAVLGLIDYQGEVRVLGCDPRRQRGEMLSKVAFISDTNTLPLWMTALQLVELMAKLHPAFDPAQAIASLSQTTIAPYSKVKDLSKGMVVQLHLALVLAINADVLVLDEPTLGLDVLYRKHFYDTLIGHYMTPERSIVISTHQLEEFAHLFTDVAIVRRGTVVHRDSLDNTLNNFVWSKHPSDAALATRQQFGHTYALVPRTPAHTDVSAASLSDIFAALAKE